MIKAIIVILSFAVGFLISRDHRRSKAVREATILVKQASKAIQDCNAESQKWFNKYMAEARKHPLGAGYILALEPTDSTRLVSTP